MYTNFFSANDLPDLTFSINLQAGIPISCIGKITTADDLFEGDEELIVTITNSVPLLILGSPVTTDLADIDSKHKTTSIVSILEED